MFNAGVRNAALRPPPSLFGAIRNMPVKMYLMGRGGGAGAANMADNVEFYIDITNCTKSSIK